ncbi:MAG: hypothetical protein ACLQG3_05535 [Terracidiphilus sp.]
MTESPAGNDEQLMEEVCERENCLRALKRVKSNKGSAGIDGMTVEQLPGSLKERWPAIREQLLSGTYKPQPVRRGARDFPNKVTGSILDVRRTRPWPMRASMSPQAASGWWTWTWRISSNRVNHDWLMAAVARRSPTRGCSA